MSLEAGGEAVMPTPPFNATVWPAKVGVEPGNFEIVRVTNITAGVATIERKQEGTSARTIQVGDQIADTITVKDITTLEVAISAVENGSGLPPSVERSSAAPPSGDETGATDTAALAASMPAKGVLTLRPGAYYVTALPTCGPEQALRAFAQTVVYMVGTGTCLRIHNPAFPAEGGEATLVKNMAGQFGGFIIDGSKAGAGSTGLWVGDIECIDLSTILIRDFKGTGSKNWLFKSEVGWCERMNIRNCHSLNGTELVTFANGGAGTGSFDYSYIEMGLSGFSKQDGLVMEDGVAFLGCDLRIVGNFTSGVGNTGTVWRLGTDNSAVFLRSKLMLEVECNGSTGTGHTTISMGTAAECYLAGMIVFQNNTIAFQAGNAAQPRFSFTGYSPTTSLISEIGLPAVTRQGSVGLGSNTVLGSDHGIVGDGTTNDTVALTAALTAAYELAANTTGKAVLDLSMYNTILVTGAVKQDAFGANSQIILPYIADGEEHENVGVTIRGKPGIVSRLHWAKAGVPPRGGTTIYSTVTGEYTAEHGIPSIIGGPTGVAGELFSRLNLKLEHLTFRQPENPSLTCVNASHLNAFEHDNIVCCTDARGITETACTHPFAIGIIYPVVNTRGPILARGHNFITGYYAGVELGENLQCSGAIELMMCTVAVAHSAIFHSNYIAWLETLKCVYHHAQVSPTGGAEAITHNCALTVGQWDIEDAKAAVTFTTKYHVWDGSQFLALQGPFDQVVPAGAGTAPEILTPEPGLGAWGVKVRYIRTQVGNITAPSVEASGKFVRNLHWAPVAVYVNPNGATITEIKVSGTVQGVTSGLVIVPAGCTINLFYTGGPPTWKWVVIA
jgi:hypothetical protein